MAKKKIKKPDFFQPTNQWDAGFPGTPGQIPGIADQLTRGFGGSMADNLDYLNQMYQPMFADKRDPYVTPPAPASAAPGAVTLDSPQAAQKVADMFRTQVVSHMPGQAPVYGSFIGGNEDKWRDAKNPFKKRMKMLRKGKLVAPTRVGGTFGGTGDPMSVYSYDPYQNNGR